MMYMHLLLLEIFYNFDTKYFIADRECKLLKDRLIFLNYKNPYHSNVTCRRVTHPSTDRARRCLTSERSRANQPHH